MKWILFLLQIEQSVRLHTELLQQSKNALNSILATLCKVVRVQHSDSAWSGPFPVYLEASKQYSSRLIPLSFQGINQSIENGRKILNDDVLRVVGQPNLIKSKSAKFNISELGLAEINIHHFIR